MGSGPTQQWRPKGLANDIEFEMPGAHKRTDPEIAEAAPERHEVGL